MTLYVAVFDANGVLIDTKRMLERFQKGIEALFKSEKIPVKTQALRKEWKSIAANIDFFKRLAPIRKGGAFSEARHTDAPARQVFCDRPGFPGVLRSVGARA